MTPRRRQGLLVLLLIGCVVLYLATRRKQKEWNASCEIRDTAPRSAGVERGGQETQASVVTAVPSYDASKSRKEMPRHEYLAWLEQTASREELDSLEVKKLNEKYAIKAVVDHVVDPDQESATCRIAHPLRIATVEVMTEKEKDGGMVTRAKVGSGRPGAEHFPLYQSILAERGNRPCVVSDCGANEGCITTFLASLGCQVYAYEALASNYRRIYSSIQSSSMLKS